MATEVNQETLVNIKTMLGSTTSVPVTTGAGSAATAVVTRVATSTANQTLLAANANRKGATIENNSTANLFVKLGATASITGGSESFTVRIPQHGYFEVPFGYTGIIDGISDAADASGETLVTELT